MGKGSLGPIESGQMEWEVSVTGPPPRQGPLFLWPHGPPPVRLSFDGMRHRLGGASVQSHTARQAHTLDCTGSYRPEFVAVLLDTGSSISLIWAHLVPQERPVLQYTSVGGVYRNVCRWPVVWMSLGYNNNIYTLDILKVNDLPFLVLLGRDAPAFGALIRAALPSTATVASEDEEPGPSEPRDNKPPYDPSTWGDDDDFQRAPGRRSYADLNKRGPPNG